MMRAHLSRILASLGVLVLAAAAAAWFTLRASLPVIDGRAELPGLSASVSVERDAAGVPTLTGRNREDLARALGYLHGQDRFFEMDLMRRAAAGELSALLGPSLLPEDRELRVHRFRDVAARVVSGADASSVAALRAYTAGVNAGLASLRGRPFEYWVLGSRPEPWRDEDTILCVHAMFLQLQDDSGHRQLQRGLLRSALPEGLWRFLEAGATDWEAAVDGSRAPAPAVPQAAEIDLRKLTGLPVQVPERVLRHIDLGSNNWAVAGSRTANGAAIVANDMHLDFRVPIIWYRVRLRQTGDGAFDAVGVTLPGAPTIVAGSNGHIAWGFTNSYGQFSRVIRLAPVANDPDAYATAEGPHKLRYVDEAIAVKGAPTEHLRVALSEWGPVMGKDWQNRPYAFEWTAQDPAAINLDMIALERIHSAAEAVRAAARFGIPGQNFMVADGEGHIGWTIAGRLPRRAAPDSDLPWASTDAAVGFDGWIDAADQPHVLDPPDGLLWSANARVVGGNDSALIGDDGMDRGARAAQIKADLYDAHPPFTPLSSLSIQLDDRAVFLERWRALMSVAIEQARTRGDPGADAAHDVLARWSGHALPSDPAYRLVNAFRLQVEARVFYMLVAPARRLAPDFEFEIPDSFEGPLWRLMQERPANLLASNYADWDAFLRDALTASEQLPAGCADLASCTWGTVNALHVAHPLSSALPFLARFLDMPTLSLPGGRHDMPRIQGPDYGASERFSVAPGHERDGYFHMPGAQSGNPFSTFYRAGFSDWAQARPTPLLPGPIAHSMLLTGAN
ncbi:MAG TPA: penicillin acylase family protein [Steroidobacteraceae bacterium]|nr:penicillin acylase family protein [Steroidobacteraceae bacterium]